MSIKEDIVSNDTKTVQVTVVILYNGTYFVDSRKDPALQIVEIALLVIVLLISFGTNIFLLVTIASSFSLRRVPFNMLLANLSIVFLFESLLNMSVALLFLTTGAWSLGIAGCAISSFLGQLVTLEVTFSLCILCAESMASVWQPFRFQSYLTVKKQWIVIVTMWASGVLLCVPLLLTSITSRIFASRYSCASGGPDGFVHGLFITVWCYGLLILIGAGCLMNLGIRQCKEYRLQKKKNVVNYSDIFIQGDLWTEWVNFKLVAWLSLFYLLLELPYIVVHQISTLKTHPPVSDTNSTVPSPITEITPKHETAFTWFRYLYSCLFACMVFKMRKDIKHKFKALTHCCCNNNIVRDRSAGPVKQDTKKTSKKNSLVPLSLNTPVLYISPDGLCLRQLDPVSKLSGQLTKDNNTSHHPKFISYFCDLDSTISSDDFSLSFSSNSERRYSKESEVSLPDMGSSANQLSEEIPMKDMSTLMLESELEEKNTAPKKSVRFAETLTIYRTLTPRYQTPTPEWVVNSNNKPLRTINGKASRIPIRKVDNMEPWKVELNTTYRVNTPVKETKINQAVVSDTKLITGSGQQPGKFSKKNSPRNKITRKTLSSPPRWKINKLL